MSFRELAEITHFHLFTMPVVFMILIHVMYLTSVSHTLKAVVTWAGFGGVILDLLIFKVTPKGLPAFCTAISVVSMVIFLPVLGAIADYTKALELNPAHDLTLIGRAAARVETADYDGAIEDYTRLLEVTNNSPRIYLWRGKVRWMKANFEEAVVDLTEAIRLAPDIQDAYWYRADSRRMLKDYPGAIADYTKAIELNPTNPEFYRNRAKAYRALKKSAFAAADEKKAAELQKPPRGSLL